MLKRWRNTLTTTFIGMVLPLPILAHHQFATEFDATKPVTLTGTVTTVDWNTPHVTFFMDVTTNGKTENWKFEGASSTTLEGIGWNRGMIKDGDKITAKAYRATNGINAASARSVILADGRTMIFCDATEDGGPQPERTNVQNRPATASRVP